MLILFLMSDASPTQDGIKGLEALTGLDDETKKYLDSLPMVNDLYNDIRQFLSKWIPECEKNSKIYLTLAIGCPWPA